MTKQYNPTDITSIFEYSKGLLGHTLRDFAVSDYEARKGKGGLGEMVEEIYFGYDKNSNPDADFSIAGVELKCTPLKKNKKEELLIKERLVCGMIDYIEEAGTLPKQTNWIWSFFFRFCGNFPKRTCSLSEMIMKSFTTR